MTSGPDRVAQTARVGVPHAAASVGQARHLLAEHLREARVPPSMREDAVLVLSELVSNAVKHAEPLSTGHIGVSWTIGDCYVSLEVEDGGGRTRPRASAPVSPSAVGGRGLDIVGRISSRWGVREGPDGVTVWAEVRPRQLDLNGRALLAELPGPRTV